MVAELLPTPAEFFDYAALRASLPVHGVTVYVEADALANYLDGRLQRVLIAATEGEVLLGYAAGALNDFYTLKPFGVDILRPTTRVPPGYWQPLDDR